MKYIMILTLTLYTIPLFTGVNCIDNSEHLQKPYDDKEWHSIECDCNCAIIKAGRCTECGHLQNARPATLAHSINTKNIVAKKLAVQLPKNLDDFFNNHVVPYLHNE